MPRKARKCSVEGCEGKHVGRGYCMKHYQYMRWHGKLDVIRPKGGMVPSVIPPRDLSSYVMLSACCTAPVHQGRPHEYGKQHCTACKGACMWKWHHKRDVTMT